MNLPEYQRWLATAARLSRRSADAEDLLQEGLLAAFEAGRDNLSVDANRAWLTGVLKNRAAMTGRAEARRRRREQAVRSPAKVASSAPAPVALDPLPGGARSVAVLLLHGLNREEIAQALGLTPAALRQRLTSVRRALDALSGEARQDALALAYLRRRERTENLEFGLIRRALIDQLRRDPGVGTHDPDGHLLVIRKTPSQKAAPRQR